MLLLHWSILFECKCLQLIKKNVFIVHMWTPRKQAWPVISGKQHLIVYSIISVVNQQCIVQCISNVQCISIQHYSILTNLTCVIAFTQISQIMQSLSQPFCHNSTYLSIDCYPSIVIYHLLLSIVPVINRHVLQSTT